jgi:hypothetical protein
LTVVWSLRAGQTPEGAGFALFGRLVIVARLIGVTAEAAFVGSIETLVAFLMTGTTSPGDVVLVGQKRTV